MKIRSPSCCSRRTKIDANWIPEKRRKKYHRCFREKWPGKRSSWRREFFFFFHRAEPNGQWIGRLQRRELVVTQSVSFAIRKRRKRATVPIGKQLDLDMPIRNGRWSVHDGQRIQKTVSESVGGRLQKFNGILLIVHWPVQLEDATSVKSVRDGRNDVTVKKFCSSLKNSSVFSINSVTGFLTFSPELMDGNNSRLSSWRTVVYKRTFVLLGAFRLDANPSSGQTSLWLTTWSSTKRIQRDCSAPEFRMREFQIQKLAHYSNYVIIDEYSVSRITSSHVKSKASKVVSA